MIYTMALGGLGIEKAQEVNANAHRYWRLLITGNNGNALYLEVTEVEMRATVSGSDQCDGGTASASSEINGSNAAAKAFDNLTGSSNKWLPATVPTGGSPAWLKYDFGYPVIVAELAMISLYDTETTLDAAIKDFTIESSDDDSSWTNRASPAAQTGWAAGEQRTFSVP